MEEANKEKKLERCYMQLYEKVGVAVRFRKKPLTEFR